MSHHAKSSYDSNHLNPVGSSLTQPKAPVEPTIDVKDTHGHVGKLFLKIYSKIYSFVFRSNSTIKICF